VTLPRKENCGGFGFEGKKKKVRSRGKLKNREDSNNTMRENIYIKKPLKNRSSAKYENKGRLHRRQEKSSKRKGRRATDPIGRFGLDWTTPLGGRSVRKKQQEKGELCK